MDTFWPGWAMCGHPFSAEFGEVLLSVIVCRMCERSRCRSVHMITSLATVFDWVILNPSVLVEESFCDEMKSCTCRAWV